jgi:hypothetical protein
MSVDLFYELQNYFNNCSPNNPACANGVTCTDCNYNYNGHTEPHYKIASQLITYLNTSTGIRTVHNNAFSMLPNPSTGNIKFSFKQFQSGSLEIFSLIGKLVYNSQLKQNNELHDLSFLPKGIYIVQFRNVAGSWSDRLVIE